MFTDKLNTNLRTQLLIFGLLCQVNVPKLFIKWVLKNINGAVRLSCFDYLRCIYLVTQVLWLLLHDYQIQ